MLQALASDEKNFDPGHPSIAIRQANLAGIEERLGNLKEAELLFRKALGIRLKALPCGHKHIRQIFASLINLMEKTGRTNEAKEFQMQAKEHEPNDSSPLELRQRATKYYELEQYAKAEVILNKLLGDGFEPIGVRHHLARICLITDRFLESEKYVQDAWELKREAMPYIVARLLWFKIALASIENKSLENYIGQLKSGLQKEGAFMEWAMQPVLDHIKPRLTEQRYALLSALVDAMNDKTNLQKLNDFEEWRNAKQEEID